MMDTSIQNKVIVITGGAGGIGSAIADVFLQKSAKNVVLIDIDEDKLKIISENLNSKYGVNTSVYYKCDITKDLEKIWKKIIEAYSTVDIFVNSAGLLGHHNFKLIIDINVSSLIEWSTKCYEHMRLDKGGKGGIIINLASKAGYGVNPDFPVYCASKYAVVGYTRCLGNIYNYRKTGVRVLAICPGLTDTDMIVTSKSKLDEDKKLILDNLVKISGAQPAKVVAEAAAEVFVKAESGTVWEILDSKPVVEVILDVKYLL